MKQTFGIIGAGNIGKAVADHLAKAGYDVTISNSKSPDTLQDTVTSLGNGVKAGTAAEAAQSDFVVLALPWSQLDTLNNLTNWSNRIVIDATNHFIAVTPEFRVADLGGLASSEVVARHVPGAHVVKAFNTLFYKILEASPQQDNGKRVLFLSGDSVAAKKEVSAVIEAIGFAPVDLGDLANDSKLQQAKGPLAGLNLIKL